MEVTITSENFESLKNGNEPLVVDFWATWCGPCRMVGPVISKLAEKYDGKIVVGKCDVEENEDLASEFGIRNIPTILFFNMASIEEELRLDEEDNLRELAFIREQIPFDAKKHYSDESILYMLDLIVDYYYESGILESNEEEIDIDMEEVANYVCRKAKEDGVTNFVPEYVLFVVQADLDYQEQNL